MRKLLAGLIVAILGLASPAWAQRVQAPPVNAVACAYNASPPTLTSGWFGLAQCDSTGKLILSSSGGGGGGPATIADGADVTQGAIADAAATAGSTGTLSAKLRLMTTQLGTINTTLGTPFQAGGSIANTSFGATLAAETTKVIGTVNQGTSPWVVSGTVTANGAVTNAGTFAVQAQPTPVTSGGLAVYFVQPTASDNHVVIKAGAGQVYKISITNNSATVNYIRLYNATTGFNGCNSATNLVYANAIPASTSGAGLADQWDAGIAFATGISICVTSGYASTDTTNATASAMNVNIGYK